MADEKKIVEVLSSLGTAKIAGFTCNKRSPMTIRIDLEIPHEKVGSALEALGLEATDEVVKALETVLANIRSSGK